MAVLRPGSTHVEEHQVIDQPVAEHTTQVVEDVGAERALMAGRLVGLIWLIAAVLEILFGMRFILKLFAANPQNEFAAFIYNVTQPFLQPFQGITSTPTLNGMVVEISTLIALLAYLLLFWIIAELVSLLVGPTTARRVHIIDRERDV